MDIGIIGCGAISDAYFTACARFPFLRVAACADLDPARAQAKAAQHGVARACTADQLLADPAVALVVNLTIPQAHAAVDRAALAAGKHVFSEKPFALDRDEGAAVAALARARGLRVGCAPDTVLGCGVQTARGIIDAGLVGRVLSGHCFMQCGGHETWHPSPEFYYQAGGGPLFDMGPYYLHALITLLGPVQRVGGVARATWPTRTITSRPKRGTVVQVEVPTHLTALLEFAGGTLITLTTSFDVRGGSTLPNIELYGEEGSIQVPDPNGTGGAVKVARRGLHDWTEYQRSHPYREGSRGVGVADMAKAIADGRRHRCDDTIALHAVDIMQAVHEAAAQGRTITLASSCERPQAMRSDLQEWVELD